MVNHRKHAPTGGRARGRGTGPPAVVPDHDHRLGWLSRDPRAYAKFFCVASEHRGSSQHSPEKSCRLAGWSRRGIREVTEPHSSYTDNFGPAPPEVFQFSFRSRQRADGCRPPGRLDRAMGAGAPRASDERFAWAWAWTLAAGYSFVRVVGRAGAAQRFSLLGPKKRWAICSAFRIATPYSPLAKVGA